MKYYLTDLAAYIVGHTKDKDPLQIGAKVSRMLRMHSVDAESLFTAIYAAKTFGVPDDIRRAAESMISQQPFYDELRKTLR